MTPMRALLLVFVLAAPTPGPDYASALAAFFKEMDTKYVFFRDKGIQDSWKKIKTRLLKQARRCRDPQTFNRIMQEAVDGLRDGHSWFKPGIPPEKAPPEDVFCGLCLAPAGKKGVVVLGGTKAALQRVPAGSTILTIDGKNARKALDKGAAEAWKRGGRFSSPQRARFNHYRMALRRSERGTVKLQVRSEGRQRRVTLPIDTKARNWIRNHNLPKDLQQGARSVWFTRLEGDIGYVWFRRMDETADKGFAKARAALEGVKGWIIDLRGNSGGGYDRALPDSLRKLAKPVAGIIDAGCFSAGETFARDLVNEAKARLFGSVTAGSSSKKAVFRLPEGLGEVRYSVASRRGYDGKAIEFNGIKPHVKVDPDPELIARGENTEIAKALRWIGKQRR